MKPIFPIGTYIKTDNLDKVNVICKVIGYSYKKDEYELQVLIYDRDITCKVRDTILCDSRLVEANYPSLISNGYYKITEEEAEDEIMVLNI